MAPLPFASATRPTASLSGRVLLLGDVHAEDEVLAAVLSQRRIGQGAMAGITAALCVGDLADGRGDLDRTCDLLAAHAVTCVRGNHDRWALGGLERSLPDAHLQLSEDVRRHLAALPITRSFSTPHGGLLLCHGLGDDDLFELRPETDLAALDEQEVFRRLTEDPQVSIVVAGHTHVAMVRALAEGLLVINPGTLRAKPGRPPTFSIVDFDAAAVECYELGPDGRTGSVRLQERTSWTARSIRRPHRPR